MLLKKLYALIDSQNSRNHISGNKLHAGNNWHLNEVKFAITINGAT